MTEQDAESSCHGKPDKRLAVIAIPDNICPRPSAYP